MSSFLDAAKARLVKLVAREVFFGFIMMAAATFGLFTGYLDAWEWIAACSVGGGLSTTGVLLGKASAAKHSKPEV